MTSYLTLKGASEAFPWKTKNKLLDPKNKKAIGMITTFARERKDDIIPICKFNCLFYFNLFNQKEK